MSVVVLQIILIAVALYLMAVLATRVERRRCRDRNTRYRLHSERAERRNR